MNGPEQSLPGLHLATSLQHPALGAILRKSINRVRSWHCRSGQSRQKQLAGRIRLISLLRSSYLYLASSGRGCAGSDWLHSNSRAGMSGNLSAPVSARSTWRKWELRLVVFQSVFCHLYGISHVLHSKSRLWRNTEKFLHLLKYIISLKKHYLGYLGQHSALRYNQRNSKEWSW